MGWDANINFKNKEDKQKVEEILELLKYKKIKKDIFMYYEEKDYKSLLGNAATIYFEENRLKLHLRTFIHCSDYDLYYMNYTIKTIKNFLSVLFILMKVTTDTLNMVRLLLKVKQDAIKLFSI